MANAVPQRGISVQDNKWVVKAAFPRGPLPLFSSFTVSRVFLFLSIYLYLLLTLTVFTPRFF